MLHSASPNKIMISSQNPINIFVIRRLQRGGELFMRFVSTKGLQCLLVERSGGSNVSTRYCIYPLNQFLLKQPRFNEAPGNSIMAHRNIKNFNMLQQGRYKACRQTIQSRRTIHIRARQYQTGLSTPIILVVEHRLPSHAQEVAVILQPSGGQQNISSFQ